ncbi:hypothetical protein C5C18_00810 [Rathayibacter tritici]|nr:hypothetical protein C5C06_03675 [Rathayibacter tritici]PPF66373.1 hypothetical protein C5C21_09155 [Rathayibacter tritici]PPG09552.1 hypothetical protein C5C18_00810 [Rathayibacter tritici]PPI13636.1 hypothetical protein C5D07_09505 [Rathayibacter tritici]
MIQRLRLPPEGGLNVIVARAEEVYGKPLVIEAVTDDKLRRLTGLFRDTETKGHIWYRLADAEVYQIHCVLHEIGHAVFKHTDCVLLRRLGVAIDDEAFRGANILRGRGLVNDPSELVAELFALELMRTMLETRLAPGEEEFG